VSEALLQQLVEQYGYWAIAIGTVLEGETLLILGGFAAHRGYLELPWVIVVAALGGWAGDQFWFWTGRSRGAALLERFPRLAQHAGRVEQLLARHQDWVVVLIRFLYGLRTAGPILIGMSHVGPLRFALFNALGAVAWATLFGVAGYVFGHAIESVLKDARHYEEIGLAAVVLACVAYWIYRRVWTRRSAGSAQPNRD
jgi:membrane protein DedA with SNARE-associated domain